MRKEINLNNDWYYKPEFKVEDINIGIDNSYNSVRLPHCNKELNYNYFDEKEFQFVSHYKCVLHKDSSYIGKFMSLHFEGVMTAGEVYLNGKKIAEHLGGYTPFEAFFQGDDLVEGDNEICVVVDSTERADIPPFGGSIDYLTYGGVYREVQLRVYEDIHIRYAHVVGKNVLSKEVAVDCKIMLANDKKLVKNVELVVDISELNLSKKVLIELNGELEQLVEFDFPVNTAIELWDLNTPKLYNVDVSLLGYDILSHRIGFREVQFREEGFYLNNNLVNIMGLNRHQSYPYVGYAMPKRVQAKDADIMKYELGLNLARCSHYPQSRHFLDRCDEIGLLVFEEIPGWQHIGDEAWQAVACNHVRQMIIRDYNHAAIILWGVRINESADCHDFYVETNRISHDLDKFRQTGGVRYITDSELLEDVYTMNDFVHNGVKPALRGQHQVTGLDKVVPYMVTEYNGHMFPTKKYDAESRQEEHFLRHLRVVDAGLLDKNISGTIGWCAFDYNTHKDFGAGDKICYHGVMDMFRLPKFAALAYRSQKSPLEEIILEPISVYARGERDECVIDPMIVATNCDKVELHVNDTCCGSFFPDRGRFKGLKYPPVIMEDISKGAQWGMVWPDAKLVGYIDGKEVKSKQLLGNIYLDSLQVKADDLSLNSGDFDATRVVVRVCDRAGNKLFFYTGSIKVEVEGEGTLIGGDGLALIGGDGAFWVQNNGNKGNIEVKVTLLDNPSYSERLTLNVI